MTVVPLPILEVEGKKPERRWLNERFTDLQVISHYNENLISLRLLNTTVTVDARKLQAAIQNVIESQCRVAPLLPAP